MIQIHVLEGKGFVWSYEDARRIREEFRMVGILVGALARKPRQNIRLGLPLQLLPEETRLLLELGAAKLMRPTGLQPHREDTIQAEPPPTGIAVYQQGLEQSYKEQRHLAAQERKALLDTLAEQIAQGQAKKRKKRGESADVPLQQTDLESGFVFPRESMMVQIPTERLEPGPQQELDWQAASLDWPHSGDPSHETRYRIYRDLWEQGHFVTGGTKFGGDFLVYPGDPMRYHAHYIVLCVPQQAPLPLYDVISAGRLGSNVKKTVLLCSAAADGSITYTSVQWSGMQ
uniref:tRNA-splicing endonuclease subunit Sen34 n=1 Tax=Sphenodon punctatus TaxID=8508 RepID=A0A8D0GUL6_SPHPU